MLCREKFDRGRQVEEHMQAEGVFSITGDRDQGDDSVSVSADGSYGRGTGVVVLLWGCVRVEQLYSVNTKVQL
jgi:hypothetical protein